MLAFIQSSPLLLGCALILLDLVLWQLIPLQRRAWRIGARLVIFLLFSSVLLAAGMSPLQPPPWPEDVSRNLMATVLTIGWWLFGARTVTVVFGLLLVARGSHGGRLLQDVLGALIFLAAVVAAAGYVMQLPVKGLLATSGVMAIVIGLALQSTLADVFSGIVLNTTRPYQIGDAISIDGTEGKVLDIDWRATRLLTSAGSLAVIPNSVAAKAKLLNFSRPSDVHGVSISVVVPAQVRPRRVLDALEKTLQGTRALLATPAPKVTIKAATLESVEYEASGFVSDMRSKGEVRNQLFDLAHRHLQAAGVVWNADSAPRPWSRQRSLLEDVRIFRSLSNDEKDSLSQRMLPVEYPADQVILGMFANSADWIGVPLIKLGEQRMLAAAQAQGQHYTPTRFRSFADADTGARVVKQVPVRIKPWFWTGEKGECLLAINYGSKQIELQKGKTAIDVGAVENLCTVLDTVIDAVRNGELDMQIESASAKLRDGFKK